MNSENQQLTQVRDRLRMLITTHLSRVNHQTIMAAEGEVVVQQDSPAEKVLLVKTGQLKVERCEEGGTPQVIAHIGPNELIGEMALIGDQFHSATVSVTHGPAEILMVQANDLVQAAIYDSDLVMELLALSSNRCRQTNRHLALILEALEALEQNHASAVKRCCQKLEQSSEATLSVAAERLRQLAERAETA